MANIKHNYKSNISIELLSYDKKQKTLTIIGGCDETDICISINGQSTVLKDCGINIDYKLRFRIDIPLQPRLEVYFYHNKAASMPLPLFFNGQMSKLSSKLSYWNFLNFQATHDNTTITITRKNTAKTTYKESLLLFFILFIAQKPKIFIMRLLYWVTKPIYGQKNIWLFADKIYKAGDNAEYLYRYSLRQNDNAYKYYVLSQKSPDASRFKDNNIPYITYRSLFQKILFLHSDIIVFTHNNAPGFYRFGGENSIYFRDLYNYDVMYIQHGLAIQETSEIYNKSIDDIKLFFVASPFETKNLLRSEYGYMASEIIPAGMARFDGLINKPSKTILISPTWRTNLIEEHTDYDTPDKPTNNFKDSAYFKIYNNVITDEKLLSYAKKYGYKINFLLHPALSNQKSSFITNDTLTVISPTDSFSYEDALIEASLLVTDYSGLQFDMAYMYKPVVHYHPPELPPSYNETVFKYESDSIGDITHNLTSLVSVLCEYMKNNSDMKPIYRNRVDSFYYHHDSDNSKRIYESILKWQSSEKP